MSYFEERFSWKGLKDKRVRDLVLCLLDYEFHVLDNAFLTHKPGIGIRTKHEKGKTDKKRSNTNLRALRNKQKYKRTYYYSSGRKNVWQK